MKNRIVHDLGRLQEKILLFGGIYSNLQALEALKAWADKAGYAPDHIFCTGDLLGYCAQPLECIDLVRQWGIRAIAGNVELQLGSNEEDCGCDFVTGGTCDLLSKKWYPFTRAKMTAEVLEWIKDLPHHITFDYGDRKVALVHGSWFHTSEFIFASTAKAVKEANLAAAESKVVIAGHCGLPFVEDLATGTWLNAGVIGMPANDGDPRTWFATAECEENERPVCRFHRLGYDHHTASQLMLEHGLPAAYAKTLVTGIWDNCEILPETETGAQGQPLKIESTTL